MCDGDTKRVVTIAVAISGTVEVSGGCNTPGTLNLACEYAAPDSVTIPDWDIWALTISSKSDPIPSMTLVSQKRITHVICHIYRRTRTSSTKHRS